MILTFITLDKAGRGMQEVGVRVVWSGAECAAGHAWYQEQQLRRGLLCLFRGCWVHFFILFCLFLFFIMLSNSAITSNFRQFYSLLREDTNWILPVLYAMDYDLRAIATLVHFIFILVIFLSLFVLTLFVPNIINIVIICLLFHFFSFSFLLCHIMLTYMMHAGRPWPGDGWGQGSQAGGLCQHASQAVRCLYWWPLRPWAL